MKTLMMVTALVSTSLCSTAQAQPADPLGDATVSRADAQKEAETRFAAMDTNHDGVISGEEMDAATHGGPGGGMMRRADTNGDGKIDKAEFATAAMRRFDMVDANKDGQLTKAERDAFRARMMEMMRNGGGFGGHQSGE